ncbi:CoA ester lyase [Phaeobacter gallaeciensis]|uniref:CoA ester lyase n=2 Tax=Roseobacteraceae TaxID=2854170 RepID=A0A366WUG0_9RHOB|nr:MULTISPECIES: CoA ester lyase [Roseobacteraceae]MBT3143843.1 CoA ester lyase [Falsiruegeria litorea]MBT8169492.1 CoA ester lyase [Falsiruegeria litorea]RBW53600.1 CoA ester lyase [Phaeobacter gallaeciensis]
MPVPPHAFGSWLFVPGDDPKKLNKALESNADVVIFDLEDAVSAGRKDIARSLTFDALSRTSRPARYVRVNDLASGYTAKDVEDTIAGKPDGYVLPKCEGPHDIETLAEMIRRHGVSPLPRILGICTETVRGVRNLMRMDWEHPMLVGLAWGGEDLQANLGARSNRSAGGGYASPFALARDLMLFAARDANVLAIDAVYTDFRNELGLTQETEAAKALGFDGKMAIHPGQIGPIHNALKPDQTEREWAAKVVALLEASETGVAQLDGEMLDRPHLKLAEQILARS